MELAMHWHRCSNLSEKCMSTSGVYREKDHPVKDGVANWRTRSGTLGSVTVPLRFAFQWDDPIRSRDYGIALFNAFSSSDKSMHINPGGHTDIPATEVESWDAFFQRHLK